MQRAHVVVLTSLVVTGCAGIIGVPDLSYEPTADAGTSPQDDASPGVDGSSNACNANLAEDARNCGRCGHSCGAGACAGGACQPYLLADGVAGLGQLTLSGKSLYFAASLGDTIRRVAKDGSGEQTPVIATTVRSEPIGLATDGTTLWYAAKGGLQKCTLDPGGGACGPESSLTDHFLSRYVSLASDSLVVASQNKVYRFVGATESAVDGSGEQSAWAVAQTSEWVYFTVDLYGIFRRKLDGTGTSTKVAERDSDERPNFVAVDGDRFFWAYRSTKTGEGIVSSATHADPTNAIVYTRKGVQPLGIAADARYVYWSDAGTLSGSGPASAGDGRLLACPRGGCAGEPTVLADKLQGGGYIVLDEDFVYFGENNNFGTNGRIRAVAKP